MKKILLFVVLVMALVACSKKQEYSISGTCDNSFLEGKDVIFREVKDGQIVREDTATIANGAFQLKGIQEEPVVKIAIVPESEMQSFIVAFEKGNITVKIHDNTAVVGGTPLNDKLQARNDQEQLIVKQIREMDEKQTPLIEAGTVTPEGNDAYQKARYELLVENTDNIIAFTKENIQNPVGKFFFMKYYYNFPQDRQAEMMAFATEDIKKTFAK